jgi:hypothetical protein
VQPADTRHIELWAWSRDPSRIPKKVWLTFTHRPIDGSSAVFVDTEPPPDRSHQGVRYEVFIHIPLIEDYSAAADNLQEAIDNPAAYVPIRCRYDWRHGLVDGAPATARATRFSARLPRPPPDRDVQEARGGRAQHAALDSRPRCEARGSGDSRGRGTEDSRSNRGDRDEHDPRAKGGDHRNDRGEREPGRRKDDKGRRTSRRGYSSSCRVGFTWSSARDGDNGDDDYDHPGLGKLSSTSFWGFDSLEAPRRERTRSPPRRSYTHHGHAHAKAPEVLRAEFMEALQASGQEIATPARPGEEEFFNKACRLLDMLSTPLGPGGNTRVQEGTPPGERAWSEPVPLPHAFDSIKTALIHSPKTTVEDVGHALDLLVLWTGRAPCTDAAPAHRTKEPPSVLAEEDGERQTGVDSLFCDPPPPALQLPAPRRPRQHRSFDMTAVRRSARLAIKPRMSAVQRAQRNLCRKLGVGGNDDTTPIDDVLRDFVAMFQGPLPGIAVAALTAIFDLDDEGADLLDNALLQHAGKAVTDLQPAAGEA